jgi:RNA polymerase sigma-70 factor (ECF subfamily)
VRRETLVPCSVDAELVKRAKAGDDDAFAEMVDRYRDAVYGYCYWRVGNFEDARDLSQETFIRAYTHLSQLHSGKKLAAWLRRIAERVCSRWLSGQREIPVETVPEGGSPSLSPQAELTRQAMASLPDKERLALVMHYINGYSYDEIAGFLDTTKGAVRSRLQRGREMLRKGVLAMVEESFRYHRLDDAFSTSVLELARSLTRVGLGWSPDGERILCSRLVGDGHQLWVIEEKAGRARPISDVGWQENYGWAPDSRAIVFAQAPRRDNDQPGSLHLHDVEAGSGRELASGFRWVQFEEFTGWAKPLWTKDSTQFAMLVNRTLDGRRQVGSWLFDAATGQHVDLTAAHYNSGEMYPGDWSHGDTQFAVLSTESESSNRRLWVCNRDGSDLQPITEEAWDVGSDPRYQPGGDWIAFCSGHGRPARERKEGLLDVWLIRPHGGEHRRLTDGSDSEPTRRLSFHNPEWTADGRFLVCLMRRRDSAGLECDGACLVDADSGEVTTILESVPDAGRYLIGFREKTSPSPDGKAVAVLVAEFSLAAASGGHAFTERCDRLCCYEIATGTLHELERTYPERDRVVMHTAGYSWRPTWSPDSQRILFTRGQVTAPGRWDASMPPEQRLWFGMGTAGDMWQGPVEPRLCIAKIR